VAKWPDWAVGLSCTGPFCLRWYRGPDAEAENLFVVIGGLRARGVAIVYITHRLDEVFRIADDVCVLRDDSVAPVGTGRRRGPGACPCGHGRQGGGVVVSVRRKKGG